MWMCLSDVANSPAFAVSSPYTAYQVVRRKRLQKRRQQHYFNFAATFVGCFFLGNIRSPCVHCCCCRRRRRRILLFFSSLVWILMLTVSVLVHRAHIRQTKASTCLLHMCECVCSLLSLMYYSIAIFTYICAVRVRTCVVCFFTHVLCWWIHQIEERKDEEKTQSATNRRLLKWCVRIRSHDIEKKQRRRRRRRRKHSAKNMRRAIRILCNGKSLNEMKKDLLNVHIFSAYFAWLSIFM